MVSIFKSFNTSCPIGLNRSFSSRSNSSTDPKKILNGVRSSWEASDTNFLCFHKNSELEPWLYELNNNLIGRVEMRTQ